MMDRLLVVPLERDLENAEPLVFEKDFVLFRRRGYGVQRRIPARRVRIRTIGCHDSLLPELAPLPNYQVHEAQLSSDAEHRHDPQRGSIHMAFNALWIAPQEGNMGIRRLVC